MSYHHGSSKSKRGGRLQIEAVCPLDVLVPSRLLSAAKPDLTLPFDLFLFSSPPIICGVHGISPGREERGRDIMFPHTQNRYRQLLGIKTVSYSCQSVAQNPQEAFEYQAFWVIELAFPF